MNKKNKKYLFIYKWYTMVIISVNEPFIYFSAGFALGRAADKNTLRKVSHSHMHTHLHAHKVTYRTLIAGTIPP